MKEKNLSKLYIMVSVSQMFEKLMEFNFEREKSGLSYALWYYTTPLKIFLSNANIPIPYAKAKICEYLAIC